MAIFNEEIRLAITAKTGGATEPLKKFETQADQTADGWDKAARKMGVSADTLKKGLAGLGTAVVGAGLVAGLRSAADAYVEAAEGANMLSQATNATVEDASRFNAVASRMGLDMNDLVEIFSDFQQAAGGSSKELEAMGVQLTKNAAGQTDWIATATDFLTTVQSIDDATERNRLLFKYFGEEGAKQLMGLVNAGMSVAEALERVSQSKILTSDDVRAAQEYTRNMAQLEDAASGLGQQLGRSVVPALSDFAGVAASVASVVGKFDGSTLLLAGGATAFALNQGKVVRGLTAAGGAMRAMGNAAIKPLIVDYTNLTLAANGSAAAIERTAVASKLTTAGFVSGLTKSAFAAVIVWEVVAKAVAGAEENLAQFGATSETVTDQMVADYAASLSMFERWGLDVKEFATNWTSFLPGVGVVRGVQTAWREMFGGGDLDRARDQLEEFQAARRAAAEASGPAAQAALAQTDAQKALNDLLAKGVFSQQEYSDAVRAAADAQTAQKTATDAAKASIDALIASTDGAWDSQMALIDAEDRAKAAKDAFAKSLTQAAKDAKRAVVDAAQAQAAAAVDLARAQATVAGEVLDAADAHDIYLESLRKARKAADTSEQRKEIGKLIDRLEEAQRVAGEGIVIGEVRFKEGTTEKQIQELKRQLGQAFSRGDMSAATSIQGQIDALKLPDLTQKVNVTDMDGKPLGDVGVKVNVSTRGVAKVVSELDALDKDIDVDVRVHWKVDDRPPGITWGAPSPAAAMTTTSQVGALLAGPRSASTSTAQPIPDTAAAGGVTFAPQIINHYPKPERASDSIAMSLRLARLMVEVD